MDAANFVQNVKVLCQQRGVKPTVACKESGVGGSFINDIERGRVPSVSKVQMLAGYLGVTTSELLGEPLAGTPELSAPALETAVAYDAASPEMQAAVRRVLGLP